MQTLVVIAIIGIFAAFFAAFFAASAHADTFQPNYWVTDTNTTTLTVSNAQGKAVSGAKFVIRQDKGLSEFVRVVSTNATATSVTIGHDVTYDGTNGTTTHPIGFTVPANFVGTNVYWTNYPPAYLNNIRTIAATSATNNTAGTIPGSNSVTATVTWSQNNQQ